MTRLLMTLFCALLIAPTAAFAKAPPPGTGASDVPANIMLLIDTSGSMDTILVENEARYAIDVAFDSNGNYYVAKYYDYIIKYNAAGEYVSQWGGYTNSEESGKFDNIYSIAVDSQNRVYASDYNNGRVQIFDENGIYIDEIDSAGSRARGVAVDSADNVFIVNGDGDIEKYNSSWNLVTTINTPSQTRYIAVASDDSLWVSTWSNREIHHYSNSGTKLSEFSTSFSNLGIAVGGDGYLYTADYSNHRVYKFSAGGNYVGYYGSYSGSSSSRYNRPRGMGTSPSGEVFVADYNNHRVKNLNGSTIIGQNAPITRLDAIKDVLKNIVSDSDLTSGARFGMIEWNSSPTFQVGISDTGAQEIFNLVDSFDAGGLTHLEEAMDMAENYFAGANSPIDPNAPCQQNIVIVLSDGFWQDDPIDATTDLLANYGVRTFVVGFATAGNSEYIDLSSAGGTYPDSPLYADNQNNLLDVLTSYIQQIISAQLTFSTPTIIPGVTNEDSILQSTFSYKRNNQWKGRFVKYALNTDGTIGSQLWDAGELLNAVPADNRNIWTVGNGIPSGLNNFTATNLERLEDPMEETSGVNFTEDELTALVEFIRGKDSYDEYPADSDDEGTALLAGERWKLGDIYHSRAVVVDQPSAYVSDASHVNSEAYYRFVNGYKAFKDSGNCGGNCRDRAEMIYVGSNGGMLHAFDSETGAEKWAFIPPSLLPALKDVISNDTGETFSIFGVDGSPVVKDVYYDGAWKTLLMAGLRQGGHSYFALDVTDPDSPEHLFTVAYNPDDDLVSYWNEEGVRTNWDSTTTPPAAFDFRNLGETWSTPVIVHLPIGSNGKWVALAGGGFNSGINPNYGSSIYVMDLENGGEIIEEIAIGDINAGNNIENSIPPRLNVITADSTTAFTHKGALVYVNDLEGNMWKVNMTDEGTMYAKTRLFDNEATFDNDRLMYHESTATITDDGELMQFFGTADMQRVGRVDPDIANRAYGYVDRNFPDYISTTLDTVSQLRDVTNFSECPTPTQNGWYMNLNTNEKITASLSVKNSTVFVPRYTPNGTAICDPGTSVLTEMDFICGENVRDTDLGAGMPTEVIVYKNKVYIGISSDSSAVDTLPSGFAKTGNLIVGDPARPSIGRVKIEGWQEE